MKIIHIAVISIALSLSGCTQQPPAEPSSNYELSPGADGGVWRMDKKTGELVHCIAFAPLVMGPMCIPAKERPPIR